MDEFKIRDTRIKEKYFMDDEYLNGYAKLCGIYATGVYISLCRHSNIKQTCFPSISLIARELDISEKTVRNSLKTLTHWKIIKVQKGKRRQGGMYAPNNYTLLDKSEWKQKPEVSRTAGTTRQSPEVSQVFNHGYGIPHKDTQIKDTHSKDIVASDTPFSLKEEIQKLEESDRRELNIIAMYLDQKSPDLQTREQYNQAIKRHVKPANSLVSFSDNQILNAVDYAKKEYKDIWTLETLIKILTK